MKIEPGSPEDLRLAALEKTMKPAAVFHMWKDENGVVQSVRMINLDSPDPLYELLDAVVAMHKAEQAYGCGFYNQGDWCAAYDRTWELSQKIRGLPSKADAVPN